MSEEMKPLTIDDIAKADDLKEIEFVSEKWGGLLYLREMTGAALDKYESSLLNITVDGKGNTNVERDRENTRAKLIACCVLSHDKGSLMFKGPEQVKLLGSKNGDEINRLWQACRKLNGLDADDGEEEEGKSEASPSSDLSTDTHES